MISLETVVTFSMASILLGLAPGPDNIFVLTQSAMNGRKAGLLVTLGLCTGLVCHTLAVALGVAVIFQVSAIAFIALKLIGAAYLLYLAWQAFRASAQNIANGANHVVSKLALYRRGVFMNITNPKVAIFFLAFLPQFVNPASGTVTLQLLLLGGLFIAATIVVFGTVALLSGTLKNWFNRSRHAQRMINKLAGMVFVGLAVKLATTTR